MHGMSITHWIVVIAIIVLLFGRGRISGLMADIGGGLRELKKAGRELTETQETLHRTERETARKITEI